jgi:PAS domain S-box-containing protein
VLAASGPACKRLRQILTLFQFIYVSVVYRSSSLWQRPLALSYAIVTSVKGAGLVMNVRKRSIERPWFRPQSLNAYLVAGLIIAVATGLRLMLEPWVADMPYGSLFPAIIVVTFLCGSAAGILATLLSVLSAWLFILPPELHYQSIYRTGIFGIGVMTVIAVVSAMRSATADVRRTNDALLVSEARFRSLLETAPDAMVIVDGDHHIALVNAQTEALFGYRRAELLGRPIELLMPQRNREEYLAQLKAFMIHPWAAPKSQVTELRGVRKDGTEFPIEVSFGPIKSESGILVSSAIRDITPRKQIEASLAEANKVKSDFLANMSHELRTPLNAIIGFSEMIRDAMIGPLDARYREYGGDINNSGRHLRDIINDILDISKIESGGLVLREEMVSIAETAEACRRIVTAMANDAGVTLSIDVPDSLPLVRLDQVRFQQILLNLMSNAVKFTPEGGNVSLFAAVEPDGAVIAVEDTGIGMNAEQIAIALEPFRQIDGPLSRRFDGTGLGLPLAKALVELHGGRLDIESAPGAGTTVSIHLPSERMIDVAAWARLANNSSSVAPTTPAFMDHRAKAG